MWERIKTACYALFAPRDYYNEMASQEAFEIAVPENTYIQFTENGLEVLPSEVPSKTKMAQAEDIVDSFTNPEEMDLNSAVHIISAIVEARPDAKELRDSLAVHFIRDGGIDNNGKVIYDATCPDQEAMHHHYHVNPFALPSAGASAATFYYTPEGEVYVLLARNWLDEKDHSKGAMPQWKLPGGYMDPAPRLGGRKQSFDHDLTQAVIRELGEETRLTVAHQQVTPLTARSGHGISNTPKNHTIHQGFLVDLGEYQTPPQTFASGDVAALQWVNMRDIHKDETIAEQKWGSDISRFKATPNGREYIIQDEAGAIIEEAIQRYVAKRYVAQQSAGTTDKVVAKIIDTAQDDAATLQPEAPVANDSAAPKNWMNASFKQEVKETRNGKIVRHDTTTGTTQPDGKWVEKTTKHVTEPSQAAALM